MEWDTFVDGVLIVGMMPTPAYPLSTAPACSPISRKPEKSSYFLDHTRSQEGATPQPLRFEGGGPPNAALAVFSWENFGRSGLKYSTVDKGVGEGTTRGRTRSHADEETVPVTQGDLATFRHVLFSTPR